MWYQKNFFQSLLYVFLTPRCADMRPSWPLLSTVSCRPSETTNPTQVKDCAGESHLRYMKPCFSRSWFQDSQKYLTAGLSAATLSLVGLSPALSHATTFWRTGSCPWRSASSDTDNPAAQFSIPSLWFISWLCADFQALVCRHGRVTNRPRLPCSPNRTKCAENMGPTPRHLFQHELPTPSRG